MWWFIPITPTPESLRQEGRSPRVSDQFGLHSVILRNFKAALEIVADILHESIACSLCLPIQNQWHFGSGVLPGLVSLVLLTVAPAENDDDISYLFPKGRTPHGQHYT